MRWRVASQSWHNISPPGLLIFDVAVADEHCMNLINSPGLHERVMARHGQLRQDRHVFDRCGDEDLAIPRVAKRVHTLTNN